MWVPPVQDPQSFSAWFERAVAIAKVAVRRVGLLLVALWLALGVAGWLLVMSMFDSDRGRELRRLLDLDQNVFGGSTTAELSDAEAERAWELIQDIFWSALPWMLVLAVVFVLLASWSVAVTAAAVGGQVDGPPGGETAAVRLGGLVAVAFRRTPVVLGSGATVLLVFLGVWMAISAPIVAVAVVGDGAAIVLTVLFVVVLALVVNTWLWVRLSLASVIAAIGGHGIGVRRSWQLTRDRFWYAAGRLLVTGLIAGIASGVVNSITSLGQFLGFAVYLAIVVVLQAVAIAASVMITVSGHVAAIEQLARRE